MDAIRKQFIAHVGENTIRIPLKLTCVALEALDHSVAIRYLEKERDIAFNTSRKEIKESTIDCAIKAVEKICNRLFEASPMPKEELHKQKKQNKLIAQQVKHNYCQMLQQKGIVLYDTQQSKTIRLLQNQQYRLSQEGKSEIISINL